MDTLRTDDDNRTALRKAARNTALVISAVLLLLAVVGVWRAGWRLTTAAGVLLGAAALLTLLAIVAPVALIPLHIAWMKLSLALGWVATRLILTLFFILVVTPFGLTMRLFGYDPLRRKMKGDSYWLDKRKSFDKESYRRPY